MANIIQRPTLFTIRIFGFSVQIYDAKVRRFIAMLYIFLQTAVLSTKWQYKKNPHRSETMGTGVFLSMLILLPSTYNSRPAWEF